MEKSSIRTSDKFIWPKHVEHLYLLEKIAKAGMCEWIDKLYIIIYSTCISYYDNLVVVLQITFR